MKWHFSALGVNYATTDAQMALSVAVTCMRGGAARWFQRLCATGHAPTDFDKLCKSITKQFGVIDKQRKARDTLTTLGQTHSVGEYIQKFEHITVCISDIIEAEALYMFIHGLKAEVKAKLIVAHPNDLNEAMKFAQSLDDVLYPRNPYMRRNQHSSFSNRF